MREGKGRNVQLLHKMLLGKPRIFLLYKHSHLQKEAVATGVRSKT